MAGKLCEVCLGTGVLLDAPCPLCDSVDEQQESVPITDAFQEVPLTTSADTVPEVFLGSYLTAQLCDGSEETYIEVTPSIPGVARDREAVHTVEVYVVLDCSGSMSGKRMRAANLALKELYGCSRVESLIVIPFGSKVAPKQTFRKCESATIASFDANLGTTNFIPPLQELTAALQSRTNTSAASETLAVFISDGACHDNPRGIITSLGELLTSMNCPLMSVALTTEVQPEIMVRLADLSGDLPLLVVQDSQADEELAGLLLDHLPLDGAFETLRISFTHLETGVVAATCDRRICRDGSSIELISPNGIPFHELKLNVTLVEGKVLLPVDVQLRCIEDDKNAGRTADPVLAITDKGRALLRIARAVVGAFIKGDLQREQAEQRVMCLRADFNSQLGSLSPEDLSKAREHIGIHGTAWTQAERAKFVATLRARRTAALEVQQEFNQALETLCRNDMRATLAAYSQQTLTNKHNKRLRDIAHNNSCRAKQIVDEQTATTILGSYQDKGGNECDMAPCLLWLCNPYEAMNGFESADQGDWVGRAVFVIPGRVAALNCWRMEQVRVRPLTITKSVILQIRVDESDGQRRAVVSGTGYPEFNACLPMISPGEHVGAVRLAVHCMKHSTAGQKALADIVCGSEELYDGAMVNAVYVTAVLSSLARATTEAEFDGVLRAFLTTLDLANAEGSASYWEGVCRKLTGPDSSSFISSKEPDALPDVARAFIPLVCTDAAFSLPDDVMKSVFAKLFVRVALDQTSERLDVYEALGIDEAAFQAGCEAHAAQANDEELDAIMQDAAVAAGAAEALVGHANQCKFHLHISKVALIHNLHMGLRHSNLPAVSRLVDANVGGSVHATDMIALLSQASCRIDKFASCVLGCDNGNAVLSDLLVVCCYGNAAGAELQKHTGKYISACFEAIEACGGANAAGLRALSAEIRERAVVATLRKAVEKVHFDRHKLEIIRAFASRAQLFLQEHPWEAHFHEMPETKLGFSTDERQFQNRDELWAVLQNGWYHAEDLEELHALTREAAKDFDFDAWKASHRHFLPGYHIYSSKNLSLCGGSFDDYLILMEQDLQNHYAGHNSRMYQREFTPKMRAWVAPYARHILQESQLVAALRKRCSNAASGNAVALSAIVDAVWRQFPELDTLPLDRRTARRRHLEVLASEAMKRAGLQ